MRPRDEVAAIVRDVVTAHPAPVSFADMDAQTRRFHDRRREAMGLTEAEYLGRFVTSADFAADDEIAAIIRDIRS